MSAPPRRTHREVIEETLALEGARVADIGCGDGSLVRLMTRLGARVTGVDPAEGQIARARAAEPAGGEDYVRTGGEDLPFADGEMDIVVFFNSLHHVPVGLQSKALAEAGRVLKSGGLLYVQEPIAAGPQFELARRIEDETGVRAKAYEALQAAAEGQLFAAEREYTYVAPVKYKDFAQFRDRMIAVDVSRRTKVEALERELRDGFEKLAERRDGAYWFDQPCRLNLLRRKA
jgi:SAM-dependent methyltransferase